MNLQDSPLYTMPNEETNNLIGVNREITNENAFPQLTTIY